LALNNDFGGHFKEKIKMQLDKVMQTNENGFTLVELMVALALSGIVMAAIYTAFLSQQRTYLAQEQVSAMQQNIRAGLGMMTREIRMAGYDPSVNASATISAATAGSITFSMDLNEDEDIDVYDSASNTGDSGENITYSLYTATDGVQKLGRKNPTLNRAVAENIDQLEFYYTLADDTLSLTPADPDTIRSVQISILAKAGKPDRKFVNTATYTTASGVSWGPYDDNFRRRLLITTVQCRNMGL
jgi:type IV pilus assembly protein PilW